MIRKFNIAIALALLTAVAVPMFSSAASANYASSQNYDHKHDVNGW